MQTVLLVLAMAAIAVAALLTDNAALILGALGAVVGAVAMARNYQLLILVYSILPTIPVAIPGTFLTPFIVATPLAMAAAIWHYRGNWPALMPPRLYLVPVAAMGFLVIIAELSTPYEALINPIINIAGALVVGTLVNAIARTDNDLRLIGLAILANLLLMAGSAASEVNWADMQNEQIRVSGLAGEPNVLGMHLGRMMPIAAAILFERDFKAWQRALAALGLATGALSLIGSASRTGAIAVAVALFTLTLTGARTLRTKVIGAGAAVLGFTVLMYFSPASFQTRVLEPAGLARGTTLDINKSDVTSGRLDQLPHAFGLLNEHPLVGVGTSGFATESANHFTGLATALHNAYLSVPVAYGLLAGIVFLFAILTSVIAGFRAIRHSAYPLLTAAIASGALSTAVALTAYPEPYRGWIWLVFMLPHTYLRASNARRDAASKAKEAGTGPQPGQPWGPKSLTTNQPEGGQGNRRDRRVAFGDPLVREPTLGPRSRDQPS